MAKRTKSVTKAFRISPGKLAQVRYLYNIFFPHSDPTDTAIFNLAVGTLIDTLSIKCTQEQMDRLAQLENTSAEQIEATKVTRPTSAREIPSAELIPPRDVSKPFSEGVQYLGEWSSLCSMLELPEDIHSNKEALNEYVSLRKSGSPKDRALEQIRERFVYSEESVQTSERVDLYMENNKEEEIENGEYSIDDIAKMESEKLASIKEREDRALEELRKKASK